MITAVQDPYVKALQALAGRLGPEKATLYILDISSKKKGLHFEIRSRNPRAARVSGNIFEGGLVLLNAGHTSLEVHPKQGYGDARQIGEIEEMCEAVLRGNFSEVVISSNEHTLYTCGVFLLKTRPFKSTRTQLSWRWLLRKARSVHQYEPYD
ncbi:MAG: hypothetical protein LAO78_20045 [Acidobacteriia bacterium]|nr:hypothetical protein [Terriglobia bacterium]